LVAKTPEDDDDYDNRPSLHKRIIAGNMGPPLFIELFREDVSDDNRHGRLSVEFMLLNGSVPILRR
jgi:hypothetical protein